MAPARERAWDCATGNGQAARGLARHFAFVEATDASAPQVAAAAPHERVRFGVAPAERTDFAARAFDAVCVAQAYHWFDAPAFHAEVRRVIRPGGVVAIWGYDGLRVLREFDAAFERVVLAPIAAHWPAQNRLLWNGYRDLPFPYERLESPGFAIELSWTLAQLVDYLGTWTAVKRHVAAGHADFLREVEEALRGPWGGAGERRVVMPLHFLCGRHGRA